VPHIDTQALIAETVAHVQTAGQIALEEQRAMDFSDRDYKPDASVITAADHRVEAFLVEHLTDLCPEANIITEESPSHFDPDRPLTFAVDPVDGTDVFSQGMPGWCVSVGLLDADLMPVAGVIVAPLLDLLIIADGAGPAAINATPLPEPGPPPSISVRSNLMVTSRIHKHLDLSGYVGKIRGIGSAALHLCFPLIYHGVIGALEGPAIHIWDIAAAHAINRAQGEDLVYLGGDPIDYAEFVDGGPGTDIVMAGRDPIVRALRDVLKRLDPA
jgi:myo-inositol-1(or 4)-monophosphatase